LRIEATAPLSVSGEDQLKGALVLPIHLSMVLLPSTSRGLWITAFWIRIALRLSEGQRSLPLTEISKVSVHSRDAFEGLGQSTTAEAHGCLG